MSIKKYALRRWRIFADSTTVHGVKEISRAPLLILKILWLFIVTLCACMLFVQIYKLTTHYLNEPVTTTVGVREKPYPVPLFLFVAHTRDLFPPCYAQGQDPQRKCQFAPTGDVSSEDQILDFETLTYARSLVDSRVFTPKDFNYRRARAKFDRQLANSTTINGTRGTLYDLLKPYMTDISDWIETGGGPAPRLRVVQRSLWNIATYFMLEPAEGSHIKAQHHDFQIETQFNWHNLSILSPMRRPGTWVTFVLTSYGLLTDAIRFEPGRIIKIRFELQSHRQWPLRRKPCKPEGVRFKMYDDQRCNESCYLKAEQKIMPKTCYVHKNYEWGFYDMYKTTRPCSFGFFYYNKDNALMNFGKEDSLPLQSLSTEEFYQKNQSMFDDYQRCVADECSPACEQLEVKLESSSREFSNELGNRSLLYATWPAVNAVTVYEVGLQYTWSGFVGQLGGLVGLWMGASMMSVCEAFYLCCCCCYDVRKDRSSGGPTPRRSTSNQTSLYRSTKDEETRYGGDYNRNGGYYTNNKDELEKLKTATWTMDETDKH